MLLNQDWSQLRNFKLKTYKLDHEKNNIQVMYKLGLEDYLLKAKSL